MSNPLRHFHRIWPIVAIGGWLLVLAIAVGSPTVPDASTGHVIPFNNHGAIHYVTSLVHYLVYLYVPGVLVIGAILKKLFPNLWKQRTEI
jgi:hypothetical protein